MIMCVIFTILMTCVVLIFLNIFIEYMHRTQWDEIRRLSMPCEKKWEKEIDEIYKSYGI